MAKATPKKAKGDNLDDLKQELDIDFHKISPEELYQRFQTHPENVSSYVIHTRPSFSGPLKFLCTQYQLIISPFLSRRV